MIRYLEHHIVNHCNLDCAGCSHFSPLAPEWFESIEQFKMDFSKLQEKSQGNIETIRLMGGEPLLHPDVAKFAVIARELFPNSDIQVVTNGVLLRKRKEELMPIFNKHKIKVCISNYGLNMNLVELTEGFMLRRIDSKGMMYNISLSTNGDKNYNFAHCDLAINKWYYFQDGRFYPCCIAANIGFFNKYFSRSYPSDAANASISIHEHTIEEIEAFLSKPIPLCNYCDTEMRMHSNHDFAISKKEIDEWTYQ